MALPLPRGLTPSETAFVCENTLVTVIPRQKLDSVKLIGGVTPALVPPRRADIPLWLALLLKRQHRANIVPPSWLNPSTLQQILDVEKSSQAFSASPTIPPLNNFVSVASGIPVSPPFLPTSTAQQSEEGDRLPYHWLEISHILLREASDDIPSAEQITRLIRDLREVRMAKLRAGIGILEGTREVGLNGVGGMEVAEGRAFIGGVIDGLRIVGASKELERREREEEEAEGRYAGRTQDDEDDEMG